jgi:hypothetical protein
MAEPAAPETAPRFVPTVLPPLVAFVLTGLLSPLYSNEPFSLGLTVWWAVTLWPAGLIWLGPPVLLLLNVRTAPLVVVGQVVIGVLGVISVVAVTRSDDAQAGVAFGLPLVFGSAAAGLLVVVDDWLRRR